MNNSTKFVNRLRGVYKSCYAATSQSPNCDNFHQELEKKIENTPMLDCNL